MLRNRICYILLLITAVMVYIFTNTYHTLLMLAACAAMPVFSLVLMLISRRGLEIELSVPVTADKKDAAFTYTIRNSSRLPVARVTFDIYIENQLTGSGSRRRASATAGGRQTEVVRLALKECRAGTLLISTRRIKVYDVFGLFAVKQPDIADETMMIYPDMREISVFMERPVETDGDGSRYSTVRPGQDVSEVFALREYAEGDEIRKIHWKLSARTGEIMVRDFSLPLNYSIYLLLELTGGSEDIVDAQVELFLSLSGALLENGINHAMGWYDAGTDVFNTAELDDIEDLETASAGVLSSYVSQEAGAAVDNYIAGGYHDRKNILIYVCADPPVDRIAALEVSQRVITVMLYEDEKTAEAVRQAIDVTAVPVHGIDGGIPEITV